jgi:hypothetical protein
VPAPRSPAEVYEAAKYHSGRDAQLIDEGEMVRVIGLNPGKENDFFRSREACMRQVEADLAERAKAKADLDKYR